MQQWNLEPWGPITTSTTSDAPAIISSSRGPHQGSPSRTDASNVTASSLPLPYRYPCFNNLDTGSATSSGFGEDTFSTWNSFEFAAAAAAQTRSVYSSPFNPAAPTPINPTAAVAAAAANQHREADYLSATAATATSQNQVSKKPSTTTYPFGSTGEFQMIICGQNI